MIDKRIHKKYHPFIETAHLILNSECDVLEISLKDGHTFDGQGDMWNTYLMIEDYPNLKELFRAANDQLYLELGSYWKK